MFASFKRIIRSAWMDFWKKDGFSFGTIFVITLTILLITSLYIFQGLNRALVSNLQEKIDISVYFKKEALEEEILRAREEISQIPEVKNIEYVSREQALEKFIEKHKENPVLMESLVEVGENPLLPALNIRAWQASQYEAVVSFLERSSFQKLIEKVDYHQRKSVIEKLSSVASGINRAGIVSSILFAVIAVLVAYNTVRLAIYNSREEIKIMKLVGASNWFVRGPFIIQGIFVGIFATLITLLIFIPLSYFLSPKLQVLFPDFNILNYFSSHFFSILLLQLATGIGIGIISSCIAIRKYLEV